MKDFPDYSEMWTEINENRFLTRLSSKDNGLIPNQLHRKELKKILENASAYLPFLNESDELRYCFVASPKMEKLQGHAKIKDVDQEAVSEVMKFYTNFVNYFFSLNSKFSFEKKFGISTQRNFSEYRDILLEHAQEDLASVLDLRRTERNDPDAEIEDSLFFFPLAGGLNRLSYYISNK